MKHLAIKVTGRVQGVFFRQSAKLEADRLEIFGWVRNEPDGSVAIAAEGSESALAAFVRWCHRGPNHARVTAVEVQEKALQGLSSFRVDR